MTNEELEKAEETATAPEEAGTVPVEEAGNAAAEVHALPEPVRAQREDDSEELKSLRTELESVREELTRLEHERFLLSRGVPEEDVDYYNFKIGKLPGAKDDFAKAAKEYLKAHPVKRASVSSGAELSGGGSRKPETSSELMNHLLRNH